MRPGKLRLLPISWTDSTRRALSFISPAVQLSDDDWKKPPDDEGITLGPEEALEREIAKSKALKVERLELRNRVEALDQETAR